MSGKIRLPTSEELDSWVLDEYGAVELERRVIAAARLAVELVPLVREIARGVCSHATDDGLGCADRGLRHQCVYCRASALLARVEE